MAEVAQRMSAGDEGINTVYAHTPPVIHRKGLSFGENRIRVSLMYISAVPSLGHGILESWIHGYPSHSNYGFFLDLIGNFGLNMFMWESWSHGMLVLVDVVLAQKITFQIQLGFVSL